MEGWELALQLRECGSFAIFIGKYSVYDTSAPGDRWVVLKFLSYLDGNSVEKSDGAPSAPSDNFSAESEASPQSQREGWQRGGNQKPTGKVGWRSVTVEPMGRLAERYRGVQPLMRAARRWLVQRSHWWVVRGLRVGCDRTKEMTG